MPNEMKNCPFCGEEILAVAKKCKHCMSDLLGSNISEKTKPEKVQKKVSVKAGFTEAGRAKNLKNASIKWKSKGWSVVETFDGGLTKTSYLMLEKEGQNAKSTAMTFKEILQGIVGIVVIIFVISLFIGEDSPETISPQKQKTESVSTKMEQKATDKKAEFLFGVEEFIKRYNQALKTLNRNINVAQKDENNNGEYLTVQLEANNKNIGLVISANNITRTVQSITFIGTGDGTMQSGLDVIFGASAVVMAVEDPNMPVDQRGKIVSDLGLSNGKLSEQGKVSVERKGVKYNISLSDTIGTWLIAEAMQ